MHIRRPAIMRFAVVLSLFGIIATILMSSTRAIERNSSSDVCDLDADYLLGIEQYPEAISAHVQYLQAHPNDALAHYHLGFAYAMIGRFPDEMAEYKRASALGLKKWDLYLNIGIAYLQRNDYPDALTALHRAVALGSNHAEGHFNLALAYERAGQRSAALNELVVADRLDPGQPDTRNMMGVVYAEDGQCERAFSIWRELKNRYPNYRPAIKNLAILRETETVTSRRQIAQGGAPHALPGVVSFWGMSSPSEAISPH